ncbi:lipoyl amidotransferase LIPT1, mitochondrial-like [Euwallacea similis]|uniref:lipoyl amidotransferase LIPT1, mitochondrial-like n=1 Tax=Euwallacea similis TaxID=1736056 RepID=UPI00344B46DD
MVVAFKMLQKRILRSPTMKLLHRLLGTRSDVAKSVYISKSTDIFTNLALEDWLYTNRDFSHHHLLMLWRNGPCVVIGRHQNPWLESNFAALPLIGAKLARRNSGGGTVYHDLENLNLTFFTGRGQYCRKKNLEVIARALKGAFGVEAEINKREDLCIDNSKISGTASKLGRTNAYHHCTLLVNANKDHMSLALRNILGKRVKTNASLSVRSKIKNLKEDCDVDVSVDLVMDAVISVYLKSSHIGVEFVDPTDEGLFPGVGKITETFMSDQWRFHRTPNFTIFRDLFGAASAFLTVEKGRGRDCGLESEGVQWSVQKENLLQLEGLFANFIDRAFSKELLDEFDMVVSELKSCENCRSLISVR